MFPIEICGKRIYQHKVLFLLAKVFARSVMFRQLIRKHVIVGLVTGDLVYHKNQIRLFMNL